MFTRTDILKPLARLLLGTTLALAAEATLAAETIPAAAPVTDCPLRDAPFSVDSPLIDVLLSPAAKNALDQGMPGMLQKFPPDWRKTDAPAFTAILSARTLAGMAHLTAEQVEQLNQKLAAVAVTDDDRVARCARYDNEVPQFDLGTAKTRVLVFDKINGFDHGPSVAAASNAIKAIGEKQGWAVVVSNKGGAFNPKTLAQFDVVVFNNNSGDVLTLSQRKAFEDYINNGGGFLGIHGAAGDFIYFWDWYADTLLGARFIGHPADPQFQTAQVDVEKHPDGIGSTLHGWRMEEEWYSFRQSARHNKGVSVVATLDESTYKPIGHGGQNLAMGADHPIVWSHCVGNGRAAYTAIGHRVEVYQVPENLTLLQDLLTWSAGQGKNSCGAKP